MYILSVNIFQSALTRFSPQFWMLSSSYTKNMRSEIVHIFLAVSKLKTNIIAELTEQDCMGCVLECAVHRFCVAINYREKVKGNEPNCQMTNTTEQTFEENASKEDSVWTFRKVNVDRSQVVSILAQKSLMS